MSLFFPAYIEDEEDIEENIDTDDAMPKEYGIDFKTGQLTGEIVTGLEAVKVWIWLALKTVRYRYYIYTWDYGCELEELVGNTYSEEYMEATARYMVEDCLLINDNIEDISDFSILVNGNSIIISFTANTLYGDVRFNDMKVSQGVA